MPIESIQQFVQYMESSVITMSMKIGRCFILQAIKGLVSGSDRYSRYLSAEEYRQLIQYTEGDLASVDLY